MVNIGESLKVGWRKFKERPWYLMGILLAMIGLFLATASANALFTALSYIVLGGYVTMLFMHYDGKHIVFDDFFSIDRRWIYFTFVSIVKGFLILVGLIFFVIPGIYLAVRWMFAEFLVIDRGLRPLEALRASSSLTEGHRWKLFVFAVVIILISFLGLMLFVIGVIPASLIVTFATIHIYRQLENRPTPTSEIAGEEQSTSSI